MTSTKKATPAQVAVLQNLAAGRPANQHIRGRSAGGGFDVTMSALHRFGWISRGEITEAGRAALTAALGSLCGVCQRDPKKVNDDDRECSLPECPHRGRAWVGMTPPAKTNPVAKIRPEAERLFDNPENAQ